MAEAEEVPAMVESPSEAEELMTGIEKAEREALRFVFEPEKIDPEMGEVMLQIKQLAEKMLYRWKTFPIVLPPSITSIVTENTSTSKKDLSFRDLFISPLFDEVEEVSRDGGGGQKLLNEKQLKMVFYNGEFEVDSIHFPGQVHRWRLTQLLQKGTQRAHDTFLDDMATSLKLLIITAKNRFYSHFFSLSNSVKGWAKGLWKLLDILIGMPSNSPGDVEYQLHEEHMAYLVAELDIKTNCRREFDTFCEYVKEKCQTLREETHKSTDLRPPPIPYCYQTPKGLDIDLRLFNKDLMNKCLPLLYTILDHESKGWYVRFQQKLLTELKEKNLPVEEISKTVNEAVMTEYLLRVYNAILTSSELNDLQQGIGQLLIDQAKSALVMEKSTMNINAKLELHKEQLLQHLKKTYPVKSRITAWMNEQLRAFEDEFVAQHQWAAHQDAIKMCEQQGLTQAVYFLKRDLNFIKERETVLKEELEMVKVPNREYTFYMRTWIPQNWVVTRHFRGISEVTPTVIVPHGPNSAHNFSQGEENYSVDKGTSRQSTTRLPFWRWWNYLERTWAWTWNSIFFLMVVLPWCSPISFRALLSSKPFIPDLKVSQIDGSLFPDKSSLTQTLMSRLTALWHHVRKSRRDFEEASDTGFLGKSLTRHLNRFWNYVVKGALGSAALVLIFPPLCAIVSGLSLVAACLAPAWMPIVVLVVHVGFFLLYDFDAPDYSSNQFSILCEAVFYRILLQGCLQPITALVFGAVLCPLASFAVCVFGLMKRGCRGLWDTFMFHAVIKTRARVPARDSFVAKRIAGPGLASNYFFQIRPEQALAALEARIELEELRAWEANTQVVISAPILEFRHFVESCFSPFSAGILNDGVYKELTKETEKYREQLRTKVNKRTEQLNTALTSSLRDKVKLPVKELKLSIIYASKLMEDFYPAHIFPKLHLSETEFWEQQGLEPADWTGLASKLYSQVFSKSFLVPLEESDNQFELQVNHLNLSRYVDMLNSAAFRDDLDSITEVHTPAGEITTSPPDIDVAYFNPNQNVSEHVGAKPFRNLQNPWKRWKRVWTPPIFTKLEIPLPIPHPALIAVSIYNRENDQEPISGDDTYCQRIIRATKEMSIDGMHVCDPENDSPTPIPVGGRDGEEEEANGGPMADRALDDVTDSDSDYEN